ncbi:MFS transporter [Roseomonas aerophila]|uniref:MFS transporter n=1 Tax=Teichococcus aerophilus TaxID=1224513 RepID=A0ABR7RN75_9PROT|nr:MFS transporter [Pseudoroseomonas aerophila]MBC9207552.1 MFS transporter [Pseudoroseomonas aerophila]
MRARRQWRAARRRGWGRPGLLTLAGFAAFGGLQRALSTRNARIFFGGSLTAWTGLWMHRIAVTWLAWEMTGSAFWVGVVAFSDLAPAAFISPIAGAVADRVDRVKLTTISQAVIALEAASVATLVATGQITIGLLIALELISGTAASFLQPARQTLLPGIVPKGELPAAVACNSLVFNLARFIGPGLAGPIIAVFGVAPAVACNSLAYCLALLSMVLMRVEPEHRRGHPSTGSLLGEVKDGFRYIANHPGLGPLMMYAAMIAVLLRCVQELLPPFVERIFGRGADSLAMLTACFGVGALIGGMWLMARGRLEGATKVAIFSGLTQAIAVGGFVATGWFPFGLLCAAGIGFSASLHGTAVQTLAQTAAQPDMRGRVLALWGLITRACPALGALMLGTAGEAFGLRLPVAVAVLLALCVFAWGLTRMRRIEASLEAPPA